MAKETSNWRDLHRFLRLTHVEEAFVRTEKNETEPNYGQKNVTDNSPDAPLLLLWSGQRASGVTSFGRRHCLCTGDWSNRIEEWRRHRAFPGMPVHRWYWRETVSIGNQQLRDGRPHIV